MSEARARLVPSTRVEAPVAGPVLGGSRHRPRVWLRPEDGPDDERRLALVLTRDRRGKTRDSIRYSPLHRTAHGNCFTEVTLDPEADVSVTIGVLHLGRSLVETTGSDLRHRFGLPPAWTWRAELESLEDSHAVRFGPSGDSSRLSLIVDTIREPETRSLASSWAGWSEAALLVLGVSRPERRGSSLRGPPLVLDHWNRMNAQQRLACRRCLTWVVERGEDEDTDSPAAPVDERPPQEVYLDRRVMLSVAGEDNLIIRACRDLNEPDDPVLLWLQPTAERTALVSLAHAPEDAEPRRTFILLLGGIGEDSSEQDSRTLPHDIGISTRRLEPGPLLVEVDDESANPRLQPLDVRAAPTHGESS
ncbi:MAG: hypothetical protein AAF533_18940 [Acidobacteriota bacterium]